MTININILDVIFKTVPFVNCVVILFLSAYRGLTSNRIQQLDAGIFSNLAQLEYL